MKLFGMFAVVALISLNSFAVEKDAKEVAKADHDKSVRAEESVKSREAKAKKSKSEAKDDAASKCVSDR